MLRIASNLTSLHGLLAANRRYAIGPLSPSDVLDLADIYSMAAGHHHANADRCRAAGYDDETHTRLERMIGKLQDAYTEPTAHDYTQLKSCLSRARQYFCMEYKHSLAELCSDQPSPDAEPEGHPVMHLLNAGSAQEKLDAKLLESVYGDMTNLTHRLETKLAPYTRPRLEVVTLPTP